MDEKLSGMAQKYSLLDQFRTDYAIKARHRERYPGFSP